MPISLAHDKPTSRTADEGWPPGEPTILSAAVDKWWNDYLAAGRDHLDFAVEGATFRASWAGNCLRRTQYARLGFDESDPISVADAYRFQLGTHMHEEIQSIILDQYGARALVEMKLRFDVGGDVFGAVHIDIVIIDEATGVAIPIELKTVGDYAYKLAATNFRRQPPGGPRFSDLRQLALEAAALQQAGYTVEVGKLIYLSMGVTSPALAEAVGAGEIGRFAAEWTVGIDDLEKRAGRQIDEFNMILEAEAADELVPRHVPEYGVGAVVDNPVTGNGTVIRDAQIVDTFEAWQCDYCPYQELCSSHRDLVDISEVGGTP